jgi:uncharacterized membrane protein YbhN (UPF0104 family)
VLASSSLTDNLNSFFDAVGQFFANLAAVHWGALTVALVFFGLNLTLRSRAIFNTLRAAYPARVFQWRRVWGAYFAAVGFNNVVPIRGGDVIKLYLTKTSIPDSSYPATAAAFFTEAIFDSCMGVLVLIYAFTQGVFPKPPDFSKLNAFDLSYLAGHPRFTLFLVTGSGVLALVVFALLSRRVRAFWARVRQGFTILSDRRRYLRQVAALQFAGWLCRFAAFWLLLDAFRVGGSVRNTLLVFGVNAVAGAVPFTPGGAGVQQALLVKVFAHTAGGGATVAAYSVGQEIAIAAFTFSVGFAALFVIFRFRSFKEVIHAGRAAREAEQAAAAREPREAPAARESWEAPAARGRRGPTAGPRGPRARG